MTVPTRGVPTPPVAPSPGSVSIDPAASLDAGRRRVLGMLADHLIPQAHGMPSAREVVTDERLRFALSVRPDLAGPLNAALRTELGDDPARRLEALERDEPDAHAALLLTVVGGYYTDAGVRTLLGYPGQQALSLDAWDVAPAEEADMIDRVRARGPIWKDPATGRRAER